MMRTVPWTFGIAVAVTALVVACSNVAREPAVLSPDSGYADFDEYLIVAREAQLDGSASSPPVLGFERFEFSGDGNRSRGFLDLPKDVTSGAESETERSGPPGSRGTDRAHDLDLLRHPPGCGALVARTERAPRLVPIPLEHTDVQAKVSGYVASVEVEQRFRNPFDTKIEAEYLFPLPTDAAVNDFVMVIGERRIRGIIRKREEAKRIYDAARARGHTATLLSQERPNIFRQLVANIEPGKEISVDITYFHTLPYRDDSYEFVFPMVIGPRFNPPCSSDGVAAVPRTHTGPSGQATTVSYLSPDERSGHDISLRVELDAGVQIEALESTTHAVSVTRPSSSRAVVELNPSDRIPNRDFVLRYRVVGERLKANLLVHRDERGGFFSLMAYAPRSVTSLPRAPMEMVFVLDCSGSMSGLPIERAKRAVVHALKLLGPSDTFQVIRFSLGATTLGPEPIAATPTNIRRGIDYVRSLEADGGTMMIEGIRAALGFPVDPERHRLVSFLTDGYIGNEAEILAEVHRSIGRTRIFSFGVGSSVNRYLLGNLASIGRGAVAYVGLDDSPVKAVERFYERVRYPALLDLALEADGLELTEVQPGRLRDVFVGRPLLVTGRFRGETGTIRLRGISGDTEIVLPFRVAADTVGSHPAIPSVWARGKLATLMTRALAEGSRSITGDATRLALEFNLISAFTSFVAVDGSRRTEGDHGITVRVPVPVPEGVRYETTVGGPAQDG